MLEKNYSKKFQKIHREAPVLESLFNKYTRLKPISLSKKIIKNLLRIYFLQTTPTKNCSGLITQTTLLIFTMSKGHIFPFTIRKLKYRNYRKTHFLIYFLLCLCSLNVLYCSIHVIQKI